MGMLQDTNPFFISPWTGNALMSVITHFLTSDNYIILINTFAASYLNTQGLNNSFLN